MTILTFFRFSQFVDSQPEDIRCELKRFYGPLLCHLYLELIKGRETKAAVDFLRKYSHLVAPVDTYEAPFPTKINGCSVPSADLNISDSAWQHLNIRYTRESFAEDDPELEYFMKLIQKISACQKLETLEQDPEVVQYRSSKYEIHTNEAVINALKTFLEKRGHVLILNLIYNWIHIHIIDNEVRQLSEDTIFMPADEMQQDDEDDSEIPVVKTKSHSSSSSERSSNKRSAEEPADVQIKTEMDASDSKVSGYNVKDCLKTLKESREQIFKNPLEYPRVVKIADKNQG